MNQYPKISIVTPSYNQGEYLESTIQSVLRQDYPNLEYIIMDGGSTDASLEIIERYADRLAHWESGRDKGQADAIYKGFMRSRGEILGWVNSDDMLLPGALKKVARYFKDHPGVECAVGGCVAIGPGGEPLKDKLGLISCVMSSPTTFETLLLWGCGGFYQPASFWRRDAFFEVGGFDRSMYCCFDHDMYLRLSRRRAFGEIKEFLACFREHPTSKSQTVKKVCAAEKELLGFRYGRNRRTFLRRFLGYYRYKWAFRFQRRLTQLRVRTGLLTLPAWKSL